MCQSPIHRDTHFYLLGLPGFLLLSFVSIPYPSGHPFLLSHPKTQQGWIITCQSPIHRDTHFYSIFAGLIAVFANCVNPLSIGTPISTEMYRAQEFYMITCQSPIHRDTHFYTDKDNLTKMGDEKVSIPYPSGHPFLRRRHR